MRVLWLLRFQVQMVLLPPPIPAEKNQDFLSPLPICLEFNKLNFYVK